MGKTLVFTLAVLLHWAKAAEELAERAASNIEASFKSDLDGTTLAKSAPAAYKPKAGALKPKLSKPKTNFFFIDDPEIATEKTKRLGGTTLDMTGKGKECQEKERAVPTYWGGGGNAGGRQKGGERTWVGKGTKQGLFNFIDDNEIFTEKTKRLGGTTKDMTGKGKACQETERAIPTYWGGQGNGGPVRR